MLVGFLDVSFAIYMHVLPMSESDAEVCSNRQCLVQVKTSTMQEMMQLLVTSGVSGHTHPAVSLQFFECVARYEKFFTCEPHFIPGILAAFLDTRGMRNPNPRVSWTPNKQM